MVTAQFILSLYVIYAARPNKVFKKESNPSLVSQFYELLVIKMIFSLVERRLLLAKKLFIWES